MSGQLLRCIRALCCCHSPAYQSAGLSSAVVPVQEAKITLVRLFQRYTFELKPGQDPLELRNTITISPKNGVIVKPIPHKAARTEE